MDIAERAANGWVVEYTDFYTPPLVADVLANTKRLAGVEVGIQSYVSREIHLGIPVCKDTWTGRKTGCNERCEP